MRLTRVAVALGAVCVIGLSACAPQVIEAGPDDPPSGGFVDVTVVIPTTTQASTATSSDAGTSDAGTSDTTAPSNAAGGSSGYTEGDCLDWDQNSADAIFSVVS